MPATTISTAIEAARHPNLLEKPAQLPTAERAWSECRALGIDTEFVRERTYRAGLGLVQVFDGKTAWLWDPTHCRDQAPIRRLLENKEIIKVLHSGSEDLEVLLHAIGAMPEPLVDTQIACAMLGQPLQLSLQGAVRWLFEVEIDKEQTRSNWLRRPLTPSQLHYAAMDVVLLPQMLEELQPRLKAAGRWEWLVEDCARMQRNSAVDIEPNEAYLRIAGAGRLDDGELRVLRALARWREETAARRDRARGFVVPDAGLLELARARPATLEALAGIEQLHPRLVSKHGQELLQAIASGTADRSAIRRFDPLNNAQRRTLKQMRQVVQRRAEELGVDPALLASRRELEKLLRAADREEPIPERFLGWRHDVIAHELLGIMG